MSISFAGMSFYPGSLPQLERVRDSAEGIAKVTSLIVVGAVATALIYKIMGAVLSVLTRGHLTFLGTAIVASPFFYSSLGLGVGIIGSAWVVQGICSFLIDQIHRTYPSH